MNGVRNENHSTSRKTQTRKIKRTTEIANQRGFINKKFELNKMFIFFKNKKNPREKKRLKQFETCYSEKIYFDNSNLHGNKNDILGDSTGSFEMVGNMLLGKTEQKTDIRYKNVPDFETYVKAIDDDYDSEDVK